MWSFDFLGVPPNADERAIKRAYATRLRSTRPDDDPEGFQRLHSAYQSALEHCRATGPATAQVAADAVAPASALASARSAVATPAQLQPVRSTPPPQFAIDDFCVAAFKRAEAGDPLALHDWLSNQQDLWSLQLKARTGHYLVQQLYQQTPPMPASCMETLLRFFDLDHVLAGHDPLDLLQLERRTRLAWQLQPSDAAGLQARMNFRTPSSNWRMHWIVTLLKRPFAWPRALWVGLYPTNPSLIADFVEELTDKHPEDLPASIDRVQMQFWLDAADRSRITRARLSLGAARSVAMLLISTGLAPLFSLLYTYHVELKPMLIAVGVLMVPSALWMVWIVWSALGAWYTRSDIPTGQWPWLRQSLLPIMCTSGLVIAYGNAAVGLTLVFIAMWLGLRRYESLHTSRRVALWLYCLRFFAVPIAFNLVDGPGNEMLALNLVLVSVAMLAWAGDLWKQRRLRTQRG